MNCFMEDTADAPAIGAAPGAAALRVRMIGEVRGGRPGPTVVAIAALHGNEPMSVRAVEAVLAELQPKRGQLAGRFVGLLGNRQAFARGQRYLDVDLNRAFNYALEDGLKLCSALPPDAAEAVEQHELLQSLRKIVREHDAHHELFVVDLHTFSGGGAPFTVFSDTLRNRRFASCWPVPMVLGLAEQIQGTLADYVTMAGGVAAVLEAGRHDDPGAARLHAAALRLALARAGVVTEDLLPGLKADRQRLRDVAAPAPAVLDIQVRRGIAPDDQFIMRPGYSNFVPVRRGEHLADDRKGPVRAEATGRILLPLYQQLGSDGYFIARPIGRLWLRLSAALRKRGAGRLAHRLPGVRRHPTLPGTLIVNPRVARLLARDVLHLLGYRLRSNEERKPLFMRRPHDLRRPERVEL